MQMEDPLPTSPLDIVYQFISGLVDAPLPGHITTGHNHSGNDIMVLVSQFVNAADMSTGNNQIVDRSMGVDIFEYDQMVVFVHKTSVGSSRGDIAEYTVLFHRSSFLIGMRDHRVIYGFSTEASRRGLS
jgi:hypothetical protein